MDKKNKSLGRDVFANKDDNRGKSEALKKILEGKIHKPAAVAKEVDVRVKLTPSNIKQLDALRKQLHDAGKGDFSRSELIRVAIALLTPGDF